MIADTGLFIGIDLETLYRFRRHAPAYLTYPAAPFFRSCRARRHARAFAGTYRFINPTGALGLNIHLPDPSNAKARDEAVAGVCADVGHWARRLPGDHSVMEIHWSGALNAYRPIQIAAIASALRRAFPDSTNAFRRATIASADDARAMTACIDVITPDRVDLLPARTVPDLHSSRRPATAEEVLDVAGTWGATALGVTLLFGDPGESQREFESAVDMALGRMPDHVMLSDVAEHFDAHRARAGQRAFASRRVAFDMYVSAVLHLSQRGYVLVGKNCFALAGSALARARMQGLLQLQADGVTTRPAPVRLAIGPGAIGSIGALYYRNAAFGVACARNRGGPAFCLPLGKVELARRAIIQRIALDFMVDLKAIEMAYDVEVDTVFRTELHRLTEARQAGLIELHERVLTLSITGRHVAGAICMVFDEYSGFHRARAKGSRSQS